MKVIQSQPKSRSSRVQPVAAAPPVQHHRGRMIAVIAFAVILLAAIVLFIVYGTQIAGKAVAFAPTTLKAGEAGIPVKVGTTMTVSEIQDFTVYAHLGTGDSYGFHFAMQYDPDIIEVVTPLVKVNIVPGLSGVTLLDSSITQAIGSNGRPINTLLVEGMSTELESGKPLQGLKRMNKNNPLVPLVKFKVKAKKAGPSGVSFTTFEVFDKDTNANLVKVKLPKAGFEVVAKAVASTCSASNLGACANAVACAAAKGVWSNNVCVASCPTGTSPDQFGICKEVTLTCSSTNFGACVNAVACATVKGVWSNNVCVASCPTGTSPDQFGICKVVTLTCSSTNLGVCATLDACVLANGYWSNNACVASCPVGTSADQFGICQTSGSTCSSSNLGACANLDACVFANGYWSNDACVSSCPVGTSADQFGICQTSGSTCSSSNLGACTTSSACKDVLGYWSNNACVATCPVGMVADDAHVCVIPPPPEVCDNKLDDNNNAKVDCADEMCVDDAACKKLTVFGDTDGSGCLSTDEWLSLQYYYLNEDDPKTVSCKDGADLESCLTTDEWLSLQYYYLNEDDPATVACKI